MADHYADLTEAEAAYWDIYTRLRELSDWEGFTVGQDETRQEARDWLVNQRKEIWRCAEGQKQCDGGAGWEVNRRAERYAQLHDDRLNNGTCRRLCQLPTGGGTPSEKAAISEREMWWRVSSVDDWTKRARQGNADWLTARRKQVWHLAEDEGWEEAERELRYDNLCVATKTGEAYEDWADTHDTMTGEKIGGGDTGQDAGTRWRLSKNFVVEEFDCRDGTRVPSAYYAALEYLCATFLEPLRSSYGDVTVNSGYRTTSYNASVGGASNSFHIYTAHDDDDPAADVSCASGSPSQWHAKLDSIRQSERNGNGGLGRYSTFVHIDLRDYPSDWTG